jgi:hypothetical protein
MHAIGVLEGVTLLEFYGTSHEAPEVQQSEPNAQEVQLVPREPREVVVECPDHKPCNFVKGKRQGIIGLLICKMQLKYYVIYIVVLRYRCWMKTLVALIFNPCPDIITTNPI